MTSYPYAIHKSSLDGGDDEVIVSSDISDAVALTVDHSHASTLCWIDLGECTVNMLFILIASSSSRYWTGLLQGVKRPTNFVRLGERCMLS